jgi:hypothetical protein
MLGCHEKIDSPSSAQAVRRYGYAVIGSLSLFVPIAADWLLSPSAFSNCLQWLLCALFCLQAAVLWAIDRYPPLQPENSTDTVQLAMRDYFDYRMRRHKYCGWLLLVGVVALNIAIVAVDPLNASTLLWMLTAPIAAFSVAGFRLQLLRLQIKYDVFRSALEMRAFCRFLIENYIDDNRAGRSGKLRRSTQSDTEAILASMPGRLRL